MSLGLEFLPVFSLEKARVTAGLLVGDFTHIQELDSWVDGENRRLFLFLQGTFRFMIVEVYLSFSFLDS